MTDGDQGLIPLVGLSASNGSMFVLSAYDGQANLANANSILWTPQAGLTCFDIGALEFQGDSADTTPPQVAAIPTLPPSRGSTPNSFTSIQIQFTELLDAISARSPGNYELIGAGLDQTFDTNDDVVIAHVPAYAFGATQVTLQLPDGVLPVDDYRLTLSGTKAIYDTAGNPLGGDANGIGGGPGQSLQLSFTPCPGYDHYVEYTDTLGAVWQPLPGGPHNSGTVTVPNDMPHRFYRVRVQLP